MGTLVPFGLYGKNKEMSRLAPLITAPPFFLYIPILCDLLQWCGCIVDTPQARADALSHVTNLVWTPQMTTGNDLVEDMDPVSSIPSDTFEWIANFVHSAPPGRRLNIVPVYSMGEERVYFDATPRFLHPFQDKCKARIGYSPRILLGFLGSPIPKRCVLRTLVGEPISSQIDNGIGVVSNKNKEELEQEFKTGIASLSRSAHISMSAIEISKI